MNRNPYRTFSGGRKSLIKGLVICFGLLVLMVLSMEVLNYFINFNPY